MNSEKKSIDQNELTFIERARRAQIVEIAIDTITSLGYDGASLAQIAKRAKISKGVISYHFNSKDELIQQVVAEVFSQIAAFMIPQIQAEPNPARMLRTYIESNLVFVKTHRKQIIALIEIWTHCRPLPLQAATMKDSSQTHLENLFRRGQETGDFRSFSPPVMATALRNTLDSVTYQIATQDDIDVDTYTCELVTLFDRATRSDTPSD